jgi:hypothetical protein
LLDVCLALSAVVWLSLPPAGDRPCGALAGGFCALNERVAGFMEKALEAIGGPGGRLLLDFMHEYAARGELKRRKR